MTRAPSAVSQILQARIREIIAREIDFCQVTVNSRVRSDVCYVHGDMAADFKADFVPAALPSAFNRNIMGQMLKSSSLLLPFSPYHY